MASAHTGIEMFITVMAAVPDVVLLSLDSRDLCNMQLVNRELAGCISKSERYQRMKGMNVFTLKENPKIVLMRYTGAITMYGHLCIPSGRKDRDYLCSFAPKQTKFKYACVSEPEWGIMFTDSRFKDGEKYIDFKTAHHKWLAGPGALLRAVIARAVYLSKR